MLEINNENGSYAEYSSLYNEKKYTEVLEKFIGDKSHLGNDPEILNIIGASHQHLSNTELAKEYYEKSSKLNPNDPQVFYNLANLEYSDKSYQKAFDLYHKALNHNLSSPLVLVQMGRCLIGLGELDDAAILFDNALENDPKCVQAYIEHAEVMSLKGDPEATINYFYKALEINPESTLCLQRLARYFNKIDRPKMALNFAQKAVNLGIADIDTFYEQAVVLHKIGYPEEAIFSLKKILEVNPRHSKAFNLIGKCLIILKKFDQAVESFFDAIYIKSEVQEYYANLGLALSELGRFKDSEECLKKAVDLSDGSSHVHYLLGRMYSKSGNKDAALEQYTIAGNLYRVSVLPIIGKFDLSRNFSELNPSTLFKEISFHMTEDMTTLDVSSRGLELESPKVNTETTDQPIVVRSFGGSKGSLYFQSLLDGHPGLSSLPGYYFKTWFDEETWAIFNPDVTNNNWRQILADDICRHFEPMFDASSTKSVLGISEYESSTSRDMGFNKLGQDRSEIFSIDSYSFKDKLIELLLPIDNIDQKRCFELVHLAFEQSYRDPASQSGVGTSIVYNLEEASSYAELNFLSHYPGSKIVSIIQNPIITLAYTVKCTLNQLDQDDRQKNLNTFSDLVANLTKMLLAINDPKNKIFNIKGIKLEDLVNARVEVMPKILNSLGITDVPQIYKSTCFRYQFMQNQENESDFIASFNDQVKDHSDYLISSKDTKILETLFWPMMESFNYTNISKDKFQKNLTEIRPWLDKPLKFEKDVFSKMAQGDLKLEETDGYKSLHKHLISCWEILSQKASYPYPVEPIID